MRSLHGGSFVVCARAIGCRPWLTVAVQVCGSPCGEVKSASAQSLERPDEEEAEVTARDTQAAFDKIVANRISAAQPKTLPAQPGAPTYIKYTPAQQARHRLTCARDGKDVFRVYDVAGRTDVSNTRWVQRARHRLTSSGEGKDGVWV